jgi:DNA repair exonuclease SbcCD nuclease subunit
LGDKNIKKIFYLYDELSSNKGLNENYANEFLNQSQILFENTINKINPKKVKELEMWVGHVKTKNEYQIIDDYFSNDILRLEHKIKGKNVILETIKNNKTEEDIEIINVPIDKMFKIASETIDDYINSLSESDKKEVIKILNESDDKLKIEFDIIKENVVGRLQRMLNEESDTEVKTTIQETIKKIETENFDKINYIKLKNLNKTI